MKIFSRIRAARNVICGIPLLIMFFVMFGCSGDNGAPGATTGTVSGTITANGQPLAGVTVSNNLTSDTATTAADGTYTIQLPAGTYTLTYRATNYTNGNASASVAVGVTTTTNVTMAEAASGKPTVTLTAAAQDVGYGGTAALTATATSPNSYPLTYSWSGGGTSGTASTATLTTPSLTTALAGSAAPSTDPGGYVSAYPRGAKFGVLPINSDTRGATTATVTARDSYGGSTTASVTVYAAGMQPGVRNVAVGIPVYMNFSASSYNWQLAVTPSDSSATSNATLANATSRNPSFVPDLKGKFTVTEAVSGKTMDIFAGNYAGAISGGTEDSSGNPSVTPDPACTGCHNDTTAADEFTPWKATEHATFFARGLNGITSNSGSCVTCHTTGYDTVASAANNGSFSSMAALYNWTYPATRKAGNWASMWASYPQVARMGSIQCENCHGPQNSDAHTTSSTSETAYAASRVSLGAEVCAQCHASGTGHHYYSEWLTLDPDTGFNHSNQVTATSESTSGSCSRCHTSEGFLQYLSNLAGGNIGSLTSAQMDWYNGSSLSTATSTAHSITCSACHDPHDATNDSQLRTVSSGTGSNYGATWLLPSGFSVVGMGKGSLCFVCHNSRNAAQLNTGGTNGTSSTTATYLHEDQVTMTSTNGTFFNSYDPTSYSAPHQACQGDVLAGRNAYFMGASLPMVSKHANAQDSCVGCHLTLNPQTHLSHGTPAVSSHVMYIRDTDKAKVCANCHGSSVDGEALTASIEEGLSLLNAQIGTALKTKLNNGSTYRLTAYDQTTGTYTTTANDITLDGTNPITSVQLDEIHGQIGFDITLTSAISIPYTGGTKSTNTFSVQMGSIFQSDNATKVYTLSGHMVRAGWNYFLIEGDGSKGIHNPSFAQGAINNALVQDLSN